MIRSSLHRFRLPALAALAIAAGLSGPSVTLADEVVQTRAALIDGGARLVFDWPTPVAFSTTVSGTRVTIGFERPLAATFDGVLQALPDQVRSIDIADNGLSVVVTLAEPSHVNAFAQNDLVVVDVRPTGGEPPTAVAEAAPVAPAAEAPPPAPAAGASAVDAAPPPAQPVIPDAPRIVDGILSVRYGLHDAYDRIVFDWPERVPYTVTNDGGLIRISFAAVARIDADALATRLPPRLQLVSAESGSESLEVTIAAPAGARVQDFYNLTKTVIDIYRVPGGNVPVAVPSTPDQMAAVPEAEGEPEPQVEPQPPAEPEPEAESAAPEDPGPAGEAVADAPAEPAPPLTPDRRAEASSGAAEPAEAPAGPNVAALATLPVSPSLSRAAADAAQPPPPAETESQGDETATAGQAAEQHGDEPAVDSVADGHDPVPGHDPVAEHGTVDEHDSGAGQDHEPEPVVEHEPELDTGNEAAPPAGADETQLAAAEPSEEPVVRSPAIASEGADSVAADAATVDVVVIDGDFEALMRLRWSEPVRAAVTKRGDRIWVVFDRPAQGFDLAAIEAAAGPIFEAPELAGNGEVLAFSVQVGEDVEPRVSAAGNTWYVQIRPRRSETTVPIVIERFEDPVLGAAVAFATAAPPLDPGEPITLQDPEIGDRMVVVPVAASGAGLPEHAAFVQFHALGTAQGLVFDRLSDDVVVRTRDGRVEVVASGGLTLSTDNATPLPTDPEHAAADPHGEAPPDAHADAAADAHGDDHAAADAHAEAAGDVHGDGAADAHAEAADAGHGAEEVHADAAAVDEPHAAVAEADDAAPVAAEPALAASPPRGGADGSFRVIDQEPWRLGTGRFADMSRRLQTEASAAASPAARAEVRVRFARFLFGHNQFRDAGGVLRLIGEDTPELFESDPSLIALRGAVAYMNGEIDQAVIDLSDRRLAPSAEVQYWRAAALAAQGHHDEAEELYAGAQAPDWYEDGLRIPLALASVDTALAAGNIARAAEELDSLPYFGLEQRMAAELAARRAQAAWAEGDSEAAEEAWADAIDSGYDGVAARAVFDRTRARFDAGTLPAAEAAAALDEVRYDWRGGEFELDLLRQLAEYQFAAGDYRSGLRTLKQARAIFTGDEDSMALDARLDSAFAELFGPVPPANVSPVTAIALFSEFEDLAPQGAERDGMLRRLAGRLVAIDLYGEAAKVLQSLLLDELVGPARGELGRDLAVLYLAGGTPQAAIDVLLATRSRDFSDELNEQRRHLRASAHLALSDYPAALTALEEDLAPAADMLRAEIYWRQGDWAGAAGAFGRLAEGSDFRWPPVPTPLPEPEPAVSEPEADPESDPAVVADGAAGAAAPGMPVLPSAEEAAALDASPDEAGTPAAAAGQGFAARTEPLEDFVAEQVLNWAMALTYADDQDGLAYLRQRYGGAMGETPYGDMFRLLVADDLGPITSVADLGRIGPNIDMFEQFLAGYRDRLAAELADPAPAESGGDAEADAGSAAPATAAG